MDSFPTKGLDQREEFFKRDRQPGAMKLDLLNSLLLSVENRWVKNHTQQWLRTICYQIDFSQICPGDGKVAGKREKAGNNGNKIPFSARIRKGFFEKRA